MHLLILNGPNLNLLGQREPQIYGNLSFENFFAALELENPNIQLSHYQSNVEGELINAIQHFDGNGIILNAGGYTHTSVAIRDAIAAVNTPVVEVHISNITGRESFRHESILSPVCAGCIFGFGLKGYQLAIDYFNLIN
jgi:3-dehydroquinate dehydratase II